MIPTTRVKGSILDWFQSRMPRVDRMERIRVLDLPKVEADLTLKPENRNNKTTSHRDMIPVSPGESQSTEEVTLGSGTKMALSTGSQADSLTSSVIRSHQ